MYLKMETINFIIYIIVFVLVISALLLNNDQLLKCAMSAMILDYFGEKLLK